MDESRDDGDAGRGDTDARERFGERKASDVGALCVRYIACTRALRADGREWTRGEMDARHPTEASTSVAHATAPAEVIIGAPSYVGTHASFVRNNGCNSSHVFFF